MRTTLAGLRWPALLALVMATGASVAAFDNLAFGGEASPILVVALLLVATATVGGIGGGRRAAAALVVWAWLPLAHVVKHALAMPDTLHPNTYGSIAKLAVFSLAVAAVGTGCGVLARSAGSKRAELRD
jgi:hypothetical protein